MWYVAGLAFRWSPFKSGSMAFQAIDYGVCSRELEPGRGVIKVEITLAVRVTGIAG